MTPFLSLSSRLTFALRLRQMGARVFAAVAFVALIPACAGLVVPSGVNGYLSATESRAGVELQVRLTVGYDVGGCGLYDLRISQDIEDDRVSVTIRGHEAGGNDTCASLTTPAATVELPPIEIGESMHLEMSLQDSVSSYDIERTDSNITITARKDGDVSLTCGNWNLSTTACEEAG